MKLTNKVALITGAGSGIGKEIALCFAKAGAKIGVADITPNAADSTTQEIIAAGGMALSLNMNVCDESQVDAGVEKLINTFGCVDILISNAGVQHIDPIDQLSLKDWKSLLAIHLDGAFLTTRACLRDMYKNDRGGSIIYMGSVHSKEASKLKAPYVTAKHGLIGLCKVVAKEGAAHNVKANVICPGYVRTPLVEKQIPEQAKTLGISEEDVIKKVMLADTVDGEFTTTEDIARVALFFASFPDKALTGQSLIASHGWFME
ncbi:MAG: 3-hydroxybutyrate dehydrogenase [Legionellales bacterium]